MQNTPPTVMGEYTRSLFALNKNITHTKYIDLAQFFEPQPNIVSYKTFCCRKKKSTIKQKFYKMNKYDNIVKKTYFYRLLL